MTDLLLAGFFIAVAAFCQLWLWAVLRPPKGPTESSGHIPVRHVERNRLETIEARADARFKEIMGEIKASNADLAVIDAAILKATTPNAGERG